MDRAGWIATVTGMRKGNGCPVADGEAPQIVDRPVAERGLAGR
jgi:hypothetical protein